MAYQRSLPLGTRGFSWSRFVPHLTPAEAAQLAHDVGLDFDAWAARYVADAAWTDLSPQEADGVCVSIAYSMWWADQEASEAAAREEAERPLSECCGDVFDDEDRCSVCGQPARFFRPVPFQLGLGAPRLTPLWGKPARPIDTIYL